MLAWANVERLGSILNLFSRDTYVVDMILARVCPFSAFVFVGLLTAFQVIQNTIRTLAVTAMIVIVIGYSFPLFVSRASYRSGGVVTESSLISSLQSLL